MVTISCLLSTRRLATTGYDAASEVVTLLADGGAFDAVDPAASKMATADCP